MRGLRDLWARSAQPADPATVKRYLDQLRPEPWDPTVANQLALDWSVRAFVEGRASEALDLDFEHPPETQVVTLTRADLEGLVIGKDGDIDDSALDSVGPFSFEAHWFNRRRLYEYCGHIPPAELETAYYAQHQRPAAG